MYIEKYKQKIQSFLLNDSTNWKSLPWQKIQLRIYRIIKHIFIAAKKHKLSYVYKLQNYLLNSNEVKVLLLDQILWKIILYYSNYKSTLLLVKNVDKLDLLCKVFNKVPQRSGTFYIISEHIKQTLIYLSLKPSWNARIANPDNKLDILIILGLSREKKNFFCSSLTTHTIKKLFSYNYINESIKSWISNKKYFHLCDVYNSNYKKYYQKDRAKQTIREQLSLNSLFYLLNKINYHDLYWYSFSYIKNSNLYLQFNYSSLWNQINYKIKDYLYNHVISYSYIKYGMFISIQHRISLEMFNTHKYANNNRKLLISIRKIQSYYNSVNMEIQKLVKKVTYNNFLLKQLSNVHNVNNSFYIHNVYLNYNFE